jgi:hypothetical protein
LPVTKAEKINESGRGLDKAKGLKNVSVEGQNTVVEVGSGIYRFSMPFPES